MMQKPVHFIALVVTGLMAGMPDPAHAYIGPGVGLGAIAVTVALLVGVVLLVIGLVWYPLKRLFKARKGVAADNGKIDGSE